jgi:hypothetical protein
MAKAVDKLSAELAFKAQVDAVTRDYICEPHVGERGLQFKEKTFGFCSSWTPWNH